ncbi:Hypothetical predicted protein [Paramuricea clavata]|nr:Hypothetical predicted protein [Paramuricea clavata]
MREELEAERKRRMEQVASGEDEDSRTTSEAKKGVNEELLHLFAFHDSKYQTESEQTRQKVEEAKDIMHAELLRRSAQKTVDAEVEKERKRKLEELEKMMRGEGENEMEIAKTSENLSKVQNDLKNAFKIATKSKENKSVATKKKSEDSKEQLLQTIRRHSAVSSVKEMSSKEQQQRIAEYDERMRGMMSDNSRDLLVNVQEQLLGLFSKLKRDKDVEKVMKMDQTKENKARMQEELIRTASSKIADREANAERARRIKEDKKRDEDVERQETVELLLNVQKQLLDTCGHLQNENLKQNAKLVQFLKARQSVLSDIRNRGSPGCSTADENRRKSVDLGEFNRAEKGRKLSMVGDLTEFQRQEKGRKLSIIGEQFEFKMHSDI